MKAIDKLTIEELAEQIAACPSQGAHKAFGNITNTQFSIARHSGGCTFTGKHYVYFPQHDCLVRDDVAKWISKNLKKEKQP